MKKALKTVVIIFILLLGIPTSLMFTGLLQISTLSSDANEPGIMLDSRIFISPLFSFERGDFVSYRYEDEEYGKHERVHRLVGKGGDTIELKNGVLFVNDENFDQNLEVAHMYKVPSSRYREFLDKGIITSERNAYRNRDVMMIHVSDKVARENGFDDTIQISSKDQIIPRIKQIYGEYWNLDHFGPLEIPEGKCFVIGDNRHGSEDSRYNGLIDESAITGTVIYR